MTSDPTETSDPAHSHDPEIRAPRPVHGPEIHSLSVDDILTALRAGITDFCARPVMSGSFGLFYALFGILFLWALIVLGKIWMIIPAAVGFPLVAPFAAAGLYEMSRRLQKGQSFGWWDILGVMAQQRKRELGWMAFVTLFVFWIWTYQVRLWLAVILQDISFSSFDGFVQAVFFTSEGWVFLLVGTIVGAGLSTVLFAVTVVSMPLLLDRETDFVTAMLTSIRVVRANPVVMLGWAAVIATTLIVSMMPAFWGLVVSLPVLGHASWHLYQRAVVFETL